MKKYVDLHVITCVDRCSEDMFDYNTRQIEQRDNFKPVQLRLQTPKQDSQLYYFFHKSTSNFESKFITVQRRKQFKSNFQQGKLDSKKFMLVGGIKLFYKKYGKRQNQLVMKVFSAQSIPTEIGNFQVKETSLPYFVIRTFGKKGFPLKENQCMKLGRTQYQVSQVKAEPKVEEYFASLQDQQILDVPPLINLKSQASQMVTPTQVANCRICLNNDDTEEDRIIHPCKCQSSIGSMHVSCFRQWMKYRLSRMKGEDDMRATFHTALLNCQICKSHLPKVIRIGNQMLPLLSFFQDFKPYLGIITKTAKDINEGIIYITVDEDNKTHVGRLPQNGVVIEQLTVSRKHAIIKLNEHKKFMIIDTESKFGTLIYDKDAEIKLSTHIRSFQVKNTVFSLKLIEE